MSSFLDARKEFLRCVGHSNLDPDFKAALIQLAAGKPELLIKLFPEFGEILKLPYESQYTIYYFLLQRKTNLEERSTEEFENKSEEKIAAEKQPSYLNRPFDIVDRFDKLLQLEKSAKAVGLLGKHLAFLEDRKKCNKQCIIGFICVMFRNGIFKNAYNDKPSPDKHVNFHDALEYCQIRYHFGSLETAKGDLEKYIQKALERIPGLKQFDDQNYQKNQTNLNIKKS